MKPPAKALFMITLSAGLVLSASAAPARLKQENHAYRAYFYREVLQLTGEQSAAIKSIIDSARAQRKAERSLTKAARLRQLNPEDADYQRQVQALIDSKVAGVRQKLSRRAQVREEIFKLLTPEQQQKILKLDQYRDKKAKSAFFSF